MDVANSLYMNSFGSWSMINYLWGAVAGSKLWIWFRSYLRVVQGVWFLVEYYDSTAFTDLNTSVTRICCCLQRSLMQDLVLRSCRCPKERQPALSFHDSLSMEDQPSFDLDGYIELEEISRPEFQLQKCGLDSLLQFRFLS